MGGSSGPGPAPFPPTSPLSSPPLPPITLPASLFPSSLPPSLAPHKGIKEAALRRPLAQEPSSSVPPTLVVFYHFPFPAPRRGCGSLGLHFLICKSPVIIWRLSLGSEKAGLHTQLCHLSDCRSPFPSWSAKRGNSLEYSQSLCPGLAHHTSSAE